MQGKCAHCNELLELRHVVWLDVDEVLQQAYLCEECNEAICEGG